MKTKQTTSLGLISTVGDLPIISFSPEAAALKAEALKESKSIIIVSDDASYALARLKRDGVKGLLKTLEEARKKFKQPVLDLGRDIDAKAKAYADELEAEERRVAKLMADHEMEEHRKREAARLEAERKQREEAEAKRKADMLAWEQQEAERLEREKAVAMANKEKVSMKDRLEQERLQEEADAAKAEAERQQRLLEEKQAAASAALAVVTVKPKGANMVINYEVTDAKLAYQHRPDLFKLVESRVDILYNLKRGAVIPGIRSWEEISIR